MFGGAAEKSVELAWNVGGSRGIFRTVVECRSIINHQNITYSYATVTHSNKYYRAEDNAPPMPARSLRQERNERLTVVSS